MCCPTIFPPKICIFVDWDGTFLPVDGDHGDGEERNANVGVLDQRLDNAPGGIAARIVSAGYEAVDAERHNQQTEAQIRNTQTATQTFVSRLHHCNIKSPRWDFIGKKNLKVQSPTSKRSDAVGGQSSAPESIIRCLYRRFFSFQKEADSP